MNLLATCCLLFDVRQNYCDFSNFIGSFRYQHSKPPQGTAPLINHHLQPRCNETRRDPCEELVFDRQQPELNFARTFPNAPPCRLQEGQTTQFNFNFNFYYFYTIYKEETT